MKTLIIGLMIFFGSSAFAETVRCIGKSSRLDSGDTYTIRFEYDAKAPFIQNIEVHEANWNNPKDLRLMEKLTERVSAYRGAPEKSYFKGFRSYSPKASYWKSNRVYYVHASSLESLRPGAVFVKLRLCWDLCGDGSGDYAVINFKARDCLSIPQR